MKYYINGDKFGLTGRIDISEPDTPVLIWAGSYISFCFKGTGASLELENLQGWGYNCIGFVVDGEERVIKTEKGRSLVTLCGGLADKPHECYIYRANSGGCGYIKLHGLILEDGAQLLDPPKKPKKRIEFYGDSVTAGEVVDADEFTGLADPEGNIGQYDNSWHSYAMRVGRMLPAEVHNVSQGGIAILDGTGYFEMPKMIGMESCYDKLRYCSFDEKTPWSFSRFRPHVIVFAIGQNDYYPNPDCIYDKVNYRRKWEDRYISMITKIRHYSPDAVIVLALTVLNHDPAWDEAIAEIKDRMGGEKNGVYHLVYSRCGKATPGHPRNLEQQEMAKELTDFLNSLPKSTWR